MNKKSRHIPLTLRVLFLLSLITVIGCGGTEEDAFDKMDLDPDSVVTMSKISEETINEVLVSLPSPLEMTILIRESGENYSGSLINSTHSIDNYITNHHKALNLGVFSTDLGYINLYNKTSMAPGYLGAIRSLAADLKVDQFFEFSDLQKLAENSDNMDTLIYLTSMSFLEMDQYLRETKRTKVSVQMVVGSWIEGLYIATQLSQKKRNELIIKRIGEQKKIAEQIRMVVDAYSADPKFAELLVDIDDILRAYEGVELLEVPGEPIEIEEDGMLIIKENNETIVEMSNEALDDLVITVYKARRNIVN